MGYDARPRKPVRYNIESIDKLRMKHGVVQMQVTISYEPWCCDGPHEYSDAIKGLDDMLHKAQIDYLKKQNKKIMKDIYPDGVPEVSE
jgi:hypothetical protein